jgi:uncharacterized membrane protein YheB (UPF0754 family)
MGSETLHLITIPLFTGAIGYATNWTGVWMLFNPLRFAGIHVPGLAAVVRLMPRKIQQIPGAIRGGLGWQGIIPSRAAKMGSIAVDKGIAKLGSPADFYQRLEPGKIAEHILATARGDIRAVVERTMEREHPALWRDLPPQVRETVHERVQQQLPEIVHHVTDEIGDNIDQLLDVKLMVIRHIEEHPELANRIFGEIGKKELRFIINFGFFFGLVLGIPLALVTELLLTQWWVLPLGGVFVGYATNYVAIWMIFEPIEPRRFGRFTIQGLFIKRQPEVAEIYSEIIADDVVTLGNIGEALLHGPRSDRTRRMIETAIRPAVDRAVGPARRGVRVAVGTREYDAIRDSIAVDAVDYTMTPLTDPDFNKEQGAAVGSLISQRMLDMPPSDFSEMLRTVIREDEWLLYAHGAVLGFGGGLLHLAVFG